MTRSLTRRDFLKSSGGVLASAYVLGLAGCGGEQGGQVQSKAVDGEVAELQASRDTTLRIMAWNIAAATILSKNPTMQRDKILRAIAEQIRAQDPDIVLLNECVIWWAGGNQVEDLARLTGLQYYEWGRTTGMGIHTKAVGILSRYPLVDKHVNTQPVSNNHSFATLSATGLVNGVAHRIFSTRIEHSADNEPGHVHSAKLVQRLDPGIPVIFGGDFNSDIGSSQLNTFTNDSKLTNAAVERPDPEVCKDGWYYPFDPKGGPDHIFYRGPYRVSQTKIRCDEPVPSDHAWILVDLSETEPTKPLQVDQLITVPESAADVDTGIDVGPGDEYAFEAWGIVYSGVFGTRRKNPRGWENIDHNPKFPLHEGDDAHPYSLLGKFEGLPYFYIGTGRARQSYADTQVRRLYLRINDDQPGNGNGEFHCRVQLWSDRPLGYQSLQSLNYPRRFIRHAWSLGELTEIHTYLDRHDATFKIVPGLADDQGISLEASNYPGHYLRHQGYRSKLHQRAEDQLFKEDVTYCVVPGLANSTWSSLRSFNFPDRYMRHRDSRLWVESGTSDLFRNDATFKIVDPFWQP